MAETKNDDTELFASFSKTLAQFKRLELDKAGGVQPCKLEQVINDLCINTGPLPDFRPLLELAPKNSEGNIPLENFIRWVFLENEPSAGVTVEKGVRDGSWVVVRLNGSGPAKYTYGQVETLKPLCVRDVDCSLLHAEDLCWVVAAKDDGWLEPYGTEWQQSGRVIFLRLLNGGDWVAAKVANTSKPKQVCDEAICLPLDGVDGLPYVKVQDEVDLLFTPHEECQAEFANVVPRRGGTLAEHLEKAFVCEKGKLETRRRWVVNARVHAQYPMRCVWVHPRVKACALAEFVRRCHKKREESSAAPSPEVVLLLGPPGAGKSSIQRLSPDEVPEGLRGTAASLKDREEVNNDNLTDCMPGFGEQYCHALKIPEESFRGQGSNFSMRNVLAAALERSAASSARRHSNISRTSIHEDTDDTTTLPSVSVTSEQVSLRTMRSGLNATSATPSAANSKTLGKSSRLLGIPLSTSNNSSRSRISWAIQWLVYAFFHHGPVRDSLAWDVIKVTVVDAKDLSVYYSSVMAGKAISRTMQIVDLAASALRPVPHHPLRSVGFWPYASQEARQARQKKRHHDEVAEQKIKGGCFHNNLLNLHYHAAQAERNILKMLDCLREGIMPSDEDSPCEETSARLDHFLIIDNDKSNPRVLFDWAQEENGRPSDSEEFKGEMQEAARKALNVIMTIPEWYSLCNNVHRICRFFLPEDDPLLIQANQKATHKFDDLEAEDILQILRAADEAIFNLLSEEDQALFSTKQMTPKELNRTVTGRGLESLNEISRDDVNVLKEYLSDLRKFCVVAALRNIRDDESSDTDSASETADDENDYEPWDGAQAVNLVP